MDTQTLLFTVVVLFAISALGGLALAGIRLGGHRNPPVTLAVVHGFAAAAGLTLLVYGIFVLPLPALATLAAILLVAAAAGGLAMHLVWHWKSLLIPAWLVWAHAGLAVLGFVLVVMAWTDAA